MKNTEVEGAEQLRRSERTGEMTEKSQEFWLDLKQKERYSCMKELFSRSDKLRKIITEEVSQETVRSMYSEWLVRYEHLLVVHDQVQKLLSDGEKTPDDFGFQHRNEELKEVKEAVEGWFAQEASKSLPFLGQKLSSKGSVVSYGSLRSQTSSVLAMERLKEQQRKVELMARASTLKEKQELETAKLNIKLKEEELQIKTELQVSDARARVLEDMDNGDCGQFYEMGNMERHRSILQDNGQTPFFQDSTRTPHLQDTSRTPLLQDTTRTPHLQDTSRTPLLQDTTRTPHLQDTSRTPHLQDTIRTPHLQDTTRTPHIQDTTRTPLLQDNTRTPLLQDNTQTPLLQDTTWSPHFQEDNHNHTSLLQNWLPPRVGTTVHHDSKDDIISVARELNKPKAEIQSFDGNPMVYSRFLRQFNARINANTNSYEERLNFLLQFTTGEAHKIVLGFSYLDAERGYKASLDEFKDRYGDPDVIAQAYVRKALDWPAIKPDNAKALDEYAIFLRECLFAAENVEAARVLEYSENLKSLVRKLPYYLHEKWRNIVYDTKERKQVVKFEQLVMFVRKEAKKAIDPFYGKEVLKVTGNVATTSMHSQGKSFGRANTSVGLRKVLATSASDLQRSDKAAQGSGINIFAKPCRYCNGSSHSMDACRGITKQPLKERYSILKSKGLCFGCLKPGHLKGSCHQKLSCKECNKPHPTLLHVEPRKELETHVQSSSYKTDKHEGLDVGSTDICRLATAATSTSPMGAGDAITKALPILPVRLKSKSSNNFIETYAFLDSGSTATFCSEEIMNMLNVEGRRTTINLSTMGHEKTQQTYVLSGLEISSLNGDHVLELPAIFTQSSLPVSRKDVVSMGDLSKWPHLQNVPLERIDSNVGLLIGVDVPKVMEPWEVIPSVGNGPFAVKTLLGWVVNGPLDIFSTNSKNTMKGMVLVNRIDARSSSCLEDQITNHFNHDFSERITDDTLQPSREDHRFLDIVTKSAKLVDNHYEIALPFKTEGVAMPNNRKQAEQRLNSLAKRLERDKDFHNEYTKFMDKIINEGYALKVSKEEPEEGRVWYLPHHGVLHPQKKKLRVVFDCAARFQGTSLNEQLLQGPNLTNTLVGTLLRFRQEEVVIMGDIDSMFYQVKVSPEDTSLLRFLWWEDGDMNNKVTEYKMVVHLFGATSSPSCANFALRKTALNCKGQYGSDVIETVLKNFYVDDCLKSVQTAETAINLVKDLQEVLNSGGFHIAKWISNSRQVMSSIPVAERAKEVKDLDLDQDVLPIERALGVQWCVESDAFGFRVLVQERPLTRRGILSMVSSVYDPLGFLAPFLLKAKHILQELCKLQLGWDARIPEKLAIEWSQWLEDLKKLSDFRVDRCMKPHDFGQVKNVQLHHFADASEVGYGTVSYLRLENTGGVVHTSFVMGKSRVAPLKQTTIPRLELTAATVAVRTDKMLRDELDIPIDRSIFWTDSMSVLRYIRNTTARFQTFVANRLAVIHDGSSADDWNYVNTKLNPADLASRGISAEELLQGLQWIEAPGFLAESQEHWLKPSTEGTSLNLNDDPEVKKVKGVATLVSNPSNADMVDAVERLIRHHSSWYKLKKCVAWILKVKGELLRRVRHKSGKLSKDQISSDLKVCVNDLNEAENTILIYVQQQSFREEFEALNKGQHVKHSSNIRKLDPILQNGLLRVGGRLSNSNMPNEAKHPIILPKGSHVSTIILRETHETLKHSGRNHMLSRLRERFWLINATSAIRNLISKCVACRRQRSRVGEQKMADLPQDRIKPDEPPFTCVGVDYFGPFEVKQGRCRVKRYGVVFTCLASRAVHLEVSASLSTDSYINALRRFIARRGQVTKMRSDNGTNFVGAEHELTRALGEWNMSQIHEAMLQRNVDWQFNPPAGSHHGGVWERMIRTVRKVMNSVIREQVLDDEGLCTLLCEIESIINDRPITRNSDDHDDLEALTPNHLLLNKRKPNLPPGIFNSADVYSKRRWRQVQYMSNLFWKRWVREYLPLLQERTKWHEQKET